MAKKFLMVGLGNIGVEYQNTRHNIGFDVLDSYASIKNVPFETEKLASRATCKLKGNTIILIKPATFMNLSGKAMKYWMDKENISLENTLVILDDLALPLSKIRIRQSGSHAGHNGLKNIEEVLASNAYARMRFGIGNNFTKGAQVNFVLGKWTDEEAPIVKNKIQACCEVLDTFVLEGPAIAMNKINTLHFEKKE
jgi:peptidyl-tRNA hydrolase, PTH1 family